MSISCVEPVLVGSAWLIKERIKSKNHKTTKTPISDKRIGNKTLQLSEHSTICTRWNPDGMINLIITLKHSVRLLSGRIMQV